MVAMGEIIYQLHRDYRVTINELVNDIEALEDEVGTLRPCNLLRNIARFPERNSAIL